VTGHSIATGTVLRRELLRDRRCQLRKGIADPKAPRSSARFRPRFTGVTNVHAGKSFRFDVEAESEAARSTRPRIGAATPLQPVIEDASAGLGALGHVRIGVVVFPAPTASTTPAAVERLGDQAEFIGIRELIWTASTA